MTRDAGSPHVVFRSALGRAVVTFFAAASLIGTAPTIVDNLVSLNSPTFPADVSACEDGRALVCDVTFEQEGEIVTERVRFIGLYGIHGVVEGEAAFVRTPFQDRIVPARPALLLGDSALLLALATVLVGLALFAWWPDRRSARRPDGGSEGEREDRPAVDPPR